jgi:iron complex outermembrane receptor protein
VREFLGPTLFLIGGPQFESEKLTAYELGAKIQPSADASLNLSAFYNDYDDLRSIEPAPGGFLPLRWGNMLQGRTYGAELWGDYQLAGWWRVSGSVSYLEERFRFRPGASQILGVSQVANDPKYQASLRSSMTFGSRFSVDNWLRYVSALPNPRLPSYAELNSSIGWELNDHIQLSVTGRNLLHNRHREYTDGAGIPRSGFADLQWRF